MTCPRPHRQAVAQPGGEPRRPGSQPYAGSMLCLPPCMAPAPGGAGDVGGGEQSSLFAPEKMRPFLLLLPAAPNCAGALGRCLH